MVPYSLNSAARAAISDALVCRPGGEAAWSSWLSRKTRYAIAQAFASNSQYDPGHRWAEELRKALDLPASVRPIFGAAPRIAAFWAEHVFPGPLDPDAGDGSEVASGVPIVSPNPAVPPALARLWSDSRLSDVLQVWSRTTAVCGDGFLAVEDDPRREYVAVRAVPPGDVREFEADAAGNCRGYVIECDLPDPRAGADDSASRALYTEECSRDGQLVVYRTFLDGEPFDWRDYAEGQEAVGYTWAMPYGFIPMVRVKHRDLGSGWGVGEVAPDVALLAELDTLAGTLSDHTFRTARAPYFFEGGSVSAIELADATGAADRWKFPLLSGDGRPHALVLPMPVAETVELLRELGSALVQRHPELAVDNVGLSASGEARREARRKVEAGVTMRRAGYDDALTRAFQMALSMGGRGKYRAYQAFDQNSYYMGELEMRIGPRPVFALDEESRLALEEQRGKTLRSLTDAGVPLATAMRRAGFPASDVGSAVREVEGEQERAVRRSLALSFSDAEREVIEIGAAS